MKASQVIKELALLIDNKGDREVSDESEMLVNRITYCEHCDRFVIETANEQPTETNHLR
jgi:hypothetical protein